MRQASAVEIGLKAKGIDAAPLEIPAGGPAVLQRHQSAVQLRSLPLQFLPLGTELLKRHAISPEVCGLRVEGRDLFHQVARSARSDGALLGALGADLS